MKIEDFFIHAAILNGGSGRVDRLFDTAEELYKEYKERAGYKPFNANFLFQDGVSAYIVDSETDHRMAKLKIDYDEKEEFPDYPFAYKYQDETKLHFDRAGHCKENPCRHLVLRNTDYEYEQ